MMRVVFFGSFQHYSAKILESLIKSTEIEVVKVITTPPMPVGRKQVITKTPVHVAAEENGIPVMTPDVLGQIPEFASTPDLFITAGYGKILPKEWLDYPQLGSLNLHFSLLPKYRGANPAEWALMCGETETGITLMQMNEGLDAGDVIKQTVVDIEETDTRETLYEKLYLLGAEKLPDWISHLRGGEKQPEKSPTPYAALLKRDDGFIPWNTITKVMNGTPLSVEDFPSKKIQKAYLCNPENGFLSRLPRALAGYPSLWTMIKTNKGEKRMKILSLASSPTWVQIEGQQPALFNQVKNQIID